MSQIVEITREDLQQLFVQKYGSPETTGPGPRRRLRFGYYQPADHYEALLNQLVGSDTDWIDIGGGSALFPHNEPLSRELSDRCRRLVAVDPSENIHENPYAQATAQSMIEDYVTDETYDLATFRMVAEHIEHPEIVIEALDRLLRPGGRVVVFTINRWSPVPLLTNLLPFSWHYPIKKFFWGGAEQDTFPVAYKMNTRARLQQLFAARGFAETQFEHLDDLSVFTNFKWLNYLELSIRVLLRRIGLRYPENCLLGVYEKEIRGQYTHSVE